MRRAFRIVAGVLGVAVIGLSLPFAITSFTDDAESIHRLHFLAGVFASGLLLGGSLLICARRPESMIGPFWVAVVSGVASTLAGVVSGDFVSGFWFTAPIALAILISLHPARSSLLRIDGIEVATVFLGLVALVPAVAFALTQAELQRNGFVSGPHVDREAVPEERARGDEERPLVADDVADEVREAAVRERDVRPPVEEHDLGAFVEPAEPGRARRAARDPADDHNAFRRHPPPVPCMRRAPPCGGRVARVGGRIPTGANAARRAVHPPAGTEPASASAACTLRPCRRRRAAVRVSATVPCDPPLAEVP